MAFLNDNHASDPELIAEVRSLLHAHDRADDFLDGPFWLASESPKDDMEPGRDPEALLTAYRRGLGDLRRADPPSSVDTLTGRTISQYEISEKLGQGGMGVVYKALDTRLNRVVALKFLPPHLDDDDEARASLVREARAASALDHVNICNIHEIGETDTGQMFIAMAYYAGETLERKLERQTIPFEEAIGYAVEIAQGLARAHEQGIAHRDVKPANVMVTEDSVVKLLDFGLAKVADAGGVEAGPVRATVAYMSPEQARGEVSDHRTDIWSLGVMLYEMLGGKRPFSGPDTQTVILAILNDEPDPIAGLASEIATVLGPILGKSLAKNPADRYDGLRELVSDLQVACLSLSGPAAGGRATELSQGGPTRRPGRELLLPEGERVQATVVVSKLGRTDDPDEQFGPEDLEGIMSGIRDRAIDVIRRNGGLVHRFAGEEIVAVFGVPTPREDDCIWAARASLELHGLVREHVAHGRFAALRLASGIDTGRVMARSSNVATHPYHIAGSPLHGAARLALHAGMDEILASRGSRRLLAHTFETEDGTPLYGKGLAEPVTTARIGAESPTRWRFDDATPVALTPFAGREKELDTLQRCLRRALADDGQVVTVIGEAGLGKSRLLYEFRHCIEHERVSVLRGHCSSHGDTTPLLPFVDALQSHFRIRPGMNERDRADRVIAHILEADSGLAVYIPLYLHLLSIPCDAYALPEHLEGEQLQLALRQALAAVFTMSALKRPLVLMLEDWHWSDDASRKVLDQLIDLVPAFPLLIVSTFRPEHVPGRTHPAHQTTVRLRPLEQSPSIEIMKSALQAEHLPEAVGRELHERTAGNPFFLEELCLALREEGTLRVEEGHVVLVRSMVALDLPNTVQAVIRTRLQRLDREARVVVRHASVVGREFSRSVLRLSLPQGAALDTSLETLRTAGLIHQTQVLPDAAYRFKHVLTQEVAYDSLLPDQRKRVHGLVGRALEVQLGDRPQSHAEQLGRHFGEAEDWSKAVHYSRLAAERAFRSGEFANARALCLQVRVWLDRLPEDHERRRLLVDLLLLQERLCELTGSHDEQQGVIDELFAVLGGTADPEMLTEVQIRQGDLCTVRGRFQQAEVALQQALRSSRASGHLPGGQKALRSLGFLRWHQERPEEALAINVELLALDREQGDIDTLVMDLLNGLTLLRRLGDVDRGLACVEELLVLELQISDPIRRFPINNNIGEYYRGTGDHTRALVYIERASELAREHHRLGSYAHGMTLRAQILFELGRFDEGIESLREAIAMRRSVQGGLLAFVNPHVVESSGLGAPLRILGEILVALERHEEALPYLEEAASCFGESRDTEIEALLRSMVASIHERQARFPAAQSCWERAVALRRESGDSAGLREALEGLGRAAREQGAMDRAVECYREALDLAVRAGDKASQGGIHNTLGIIAWKLGAFGDALTHYEHALAIYEDHGDFAHAGLMLNSLGLTLHRLDRPDDAVLRLEEAVRSHRRSKQPQWEAYAQAVLGDVHFAVGRHAQARSSYDASLSLRRDVGDLRGEGWMLHRLAQLDEVRGELVRARDGRALAAEIATTIGDSELLDACQPPSV